MSGEPPASRARGESAGLPGAAAWRRGHRCRAVAHLLFFVLPVPILLLLRVRLAAAWAAPQPDVVLATLLLLLLLVGGPLAARRDALRLVRGAAVGGEGVAALLLRLAANRVTAVGGGLVVAFALAALLAPLLAPYDPTRLGDLATAVYRPPNPAHWLGTDRFGRDVLSRLLYGARISLAIAFLAAGLAVVIGTAVGLVAGYRGGRIDGVLMRGVDLLMAFPRLFLVLLVAGLLRPSAGLVIVVLGFTGWMQTARLVRAQVRTLRHGGYVEAARALGLPAWRVVRHHVLPNVAAPVLVSATLMVGQTILAESALSFLGLGVQVPTPSWGQMIDEGRRVFPAVWWVSLFPGVAITLTVVGYNMLGDGLRDELDPRWRARGRGWLP